jgi:hypothetical protein
VLRRGAAATTHERQPELPGERVVGVRQLLRAQRVTRPVGRELRQPGVGHAGQADTGVAGQVAQVLAHLCRPGRAVEADQVELERLEGGQRGADLAAHEHRAGRLDGHLREQWKAGAGRPERPAGTVDRGLGLQQVLRRLDEHRVDPALDEAGHLGLVGVAQLGVGDVAEGGQLGAGPDRPDDPARTVRGAEPVGDLAGELGPEPGQLVDPVGDAVLVEVAEVGAERVGLDGVTTHGEVRLVDGAHDVRPGRVEDLVAALMPFEVVEGEVVILQHRAHGAVGDDDPLAQRGEQAVVSP